MSTWTNIRDRIVHWLLDQIGYYDCPSAQPAEAGVSPAPAATPPASPALVTRAPLGFASCWNGKNASQRMMNVLSPNMGESTFKKRLAFIQERGCDTAHVFLVNGGDGEAAGYRAWKEGDRKTMRKRVAALRAAGLAVVPWIIADDSRADAGVLFANASRLVGEMAEFFEGAPYVVLGLEMDEYGKANDWKKVRAALRTHYKGEIGVHHASGNSFPFAGLADIVLGQLSPGCTASQVKAQIRAIKGMGKRPIGFEYSRGPDRDLARAALDAGAEGVGNW